MNPSCSVHALECGHSLCIDRISVQYALFRDCVSKGTDRRAPGEMGLNLSVEGGNREQGAQETDSSSQQPERKALFRYNLNKIYLLEAFVFG